MNDIKPKEITKEVTEIANNKPQELSQVSVKRVFTPTRKQIQWFNATNELGYSATLKEISMEAKVDLDTYYRWVLDDRFVEWMDNSFQRAIKLFRYKLDKIGLKKAETSYSYWHDMMLRTGNIIPEGIGTQINQQFNIPTVELKRIID